MIYINSHSIENIDIGNGSIVMLGNFDGMHIGHMALFDMLTKQAEIGGYTKIVFSFHPHPQFFLCGQNPGLLLASDEKIQLLSELGTDVFIEYPFDNTLRSMTPEEFVKTILVDKLNAKAIVIGDDYSFGKNREGNADNLRKLGAAYGFDIHIVDAVTHNGERVSSRTIRDYAATRNFKRCNEQLGRPYQISGIVRHGQQLARKLGFPTINIQPAPDKLLPPNGVYLTKTTIGGQTYKSITNIGVNPTVFGSEATVKRCETYIYGFNSDVYGKKAVISFYDSIRDEQEFSGIDALAYQVTNDIEKGLELWKRLELR
ncbi:MAG: bifunctional riboflavin kinase/FAD synthetase [Defluviitaleaceae bacterium]|nr:bifunctional riboflavin kinase/FAD synthetase [Defluviitaleaceae bacterium]